MMPLSSLTSTSPANISQIEVRNSANNNATVFAAGMAAQQVTLTSAADTITQQSFTESTDNGAIHKVSGFDPASDTINLQPFADGSHVWEMVDYMGNVVIRAASPTETHDKHDVIVLVGQSTTQLTLGADGVVKGSGTVAPVTTDTTASGTTDPTSETVATTSPAMDGGASTAVTGEQPSTVAAGDSPVKPSTTGETSFGTAGNDSLKGGVGNDTVFGLAGNDEIAGATGNDILFGGEGKDQIFGNEGNDFLSGGAGMDTLNGGAGDDFIVGGPSLEGDKFIGGAGNDVLVGGDGSDYFKADEGIDVVISGVGNDLVKLVTGSEFIFWHDFQDGADRIDAAAAGISMADVQVFATLDGKGTWIGLGDTQMVLEGVDAALITEEDFTFAETVLVDEADLA